LSPEVRTALVERAAEMLARREPVTLRGLVAGVGVSTMAVYTYFDGMPGVWRAVRQEGFTRLAERLGRLAATDDAIADLATLGAAYLSNALAFPALYRTMFDAATDLDDPRTAEASFTRLVEAASRATADGRFSGGTDAVAFATRYWAVGHGIASLTVGGVLPPADAHEHGASAAEAMCIAAGDDPLRCRTSVRAGWARTADRPPTAQAR
jgi:AcrR family transcriptional regulator